MGHVGKGSFIETLQKTTYPNITLLLSRNFFPLLVLDNDIPYQIAFSFGNKRIIQQQAPRFVHHTPAPSVALLIPILSHQKNLCCDHNTGFSFIQRTLRTFIQTDYSTTQHRRHSLPTILYDCPVL